MGKGISKFFKPASAAQSSLARHDAAVMLDKPQSFHCPKGQNEFFSDSNYEERSVYVGALTNGFSSGMGCLLEDGRLLTALHVVYDLSNGQYQLLELFKVRFVKDGQVYSYDIADIDHDGTAAIRLAQSQGSGFLPTTFDYAVLKLSGNPVDDLGAGLSLDKTNHFGSAFVQDPARVLSVSAPIFYTDKDGKFSARRYISVSNNESANGGNYVFPTISSYFREEGFSGQAIFPLTTDASMLYAVHEGFDGGNAIGFKCSEYFYQYQAAASQPSGEGVTASYGLGYVPEALTEDDVKDIECFLELLRNASASKVKIDATKIPQSLTDIQRHDTHQKQHTLVGHRAGKTVFDEHLTTHDNSDMMTALLNTVDKLAKYYYRRRRAQIVERYCQHVKCGQEDIPVESQARLMFFRDVIRSINVIIDMGCVLADEDRTTKKVATALKIDGFMGATFHVIPLDPDSEGESLLLHHFSADAILEEAKKEFKAASVQRNARRF